mmetsp:Transcript_12627/g.19056  ORF Transcript_12627/g.19056 Transcript_12627/m.19056 type:complete len:994 (+) Transcript_12627:164-3145(+)|eukprot:CAMPEP_0185040416 /NCGR_PEP_ID=MMETSP1103-20130426/38440_1 /TAXON_ID=36769 /ORGANISM="Paraphysomonas bandaiensis, Strain Caron Lab Isolate" /LENGTH=993 /DNA_ID=CAMNT_0027579711 /DNA_START=129 /DNA_END=3110 /DNA_ORIENTATION=+
MENIAFNSAMHDFTGSHRLESEDPRWSTLFQYPETLMLKGNEPMWKSYCSRLLSNNITTGNLITLLEKTVSKIRQVVMSRNKSGALQQCCVAMHITGLILHSFISQVHSSEMRRQLGLPQSYNASVVSRGPRNANSVSSDPFAHGEWVVQELLEEIVELLHANAHVTWLYDAFYFACNLLLCMLSSQLYIPSAQGPDARSEMSRDPQLNYCQQESEDNIFMSYLFVIASVQMKDALHRPDIASTDALPCKLIKSLIMHTTAAASIPSSLSMNRLVNFNHRLASSSSSQFSSIQSTTEAEVEVRPTNSISVSNSALSSVGVWSIIGSWINMPLNVVRHVAAYYLDDYWMYGYSYRANTPHSKQIASPNNAGGSVASSDVLAERALSVLHVLIQNKRSRRVDNSTVPHNPFRQAFCMLHDQNMEAVLHDGDEEMGVRQGAGEFRLHVDFRELTRSLASHVSSENHSMLIYSLLQSHPTYLPSIAASGAVKPLLIALLEQLYNINENSLSTTRVDALYVVVINILMIVQDSSLKPVLCKLQLDTQLSWYKEKCLSNVSMGDLVVLCVLRGAVNSMFAIKDSYLLTNTLAVLMDIAPYLQKVHSYTAERLVSVTYRLCKRYSTLMNKVKSHRLNPKFHQNSVTRDPHATLGEPTPSTSKSNVESSKNNEIEKEEAEVVIGANYLPSAAESTEVNIYNATSTEAQYYKSQSSESQWEDSSANRLQRMESCGQDLPEDFDFRLEVMEETLYALILTIGCALRGTRRKSNIHLVYALARKHDAVCEALSSPEICSLFNCDTRNIFVETVNKDTSFDLENSDDESTITTSTKTAEATDSNTVMQRNCSPEPRKERMDRYDSQLKANKSILTLADIAALTRRTVRVLEEFSSGNGGDNSGIQTADDALRVLTENIGDDGTCLPPFSATEECELTFRYEEGENPEAFFVPYIWETAVRKCVDVAWDTERISLFDVFPYDSAVEPPVEQKDGDYEDRSNVSDIV